MEKMPVGLSNLDISFLSMSQIEKLNDGSPNNPYNNILLQLASKDDVIGVVSVKLPDASLLTKRIHSDKSSFPFDDINTHFSFSYFIHDIRGTYNLDIVQENMNNNNGIFVGYAECWYCRDTTHIDGRIWPIYIDKKHFLRFAH